MSKRHLYAELNNLTLSLNPEESQIERFIHSKTIMFLSRIFRKFPLCVLTSESVEFLGWLFAENRTFIEDISLDAHKKYAKKPDKLTMAHFWETDNDWHEDIYNMWKPLHHDDKIDIANKITEELENLSEKNNRIKNSEAETGILEFAKAFDLSITEIDFCYLCAIFSFSEKIKDYFNSSFLIKEPLGAKILTAALNVKENELTQILTGKLFQLGIVEIDFSGGLDFDYKIFKKFTNNLLKKEILDEKFFAIGKNTIPLEYHQIEREKIDFLLNLLDKNTDEPVHILFYGEPGTGKTEFARAIISKLGIKGYEIGQDIKNSITDRKTQIILCISFVQNTKENSIIIVDEADSILNTEMGFSRYGEFNDKGWLNQMLERKNTKMIWITNQTDNIPDSVKRRFAFGLKFKKFNKNQRDLLWKNIIAKHELNNFININDNDIRQLIEKYNVSPAILDNSAQRVMISGCNNKKDFLIRFGMSLDFHSKILYENDNKKSHIPIDGNYSVEGLNIGYNIHNLLNHLERFVKNHKKTDKNPLNRVNLLFYGHPGTGKTELAKYLSVYLDKSLYCKRISDIVSCWVGSTEKNLRNHFEEAQSRDAILLLDEADSLLFNRDRAVRSWETSFTNEFLSQMDLYTGILICTTNRINELDVASLRRFQFKIKFDFLTPSGTLIFYERFLSKLVDKPLNDTAKKNIQSLEMLAPGDFSIVRNRFFFYDRNELTHNDLISALKEESEMKKNHAGEKKIGF